MLWTIGRLAGIQAPGSHQPSSRPVLGIVGQTHISFKRPGMPLLFWCVTSKPAPPNNQRFPFLSVQVMAESLPPGVLSFSEAKGGGGIGVLGVQVGSLAPP